MAQFKNTFCFIILTICLASCNERRVESKKVETPKTFITGNFDSLRLPLIKNISFIGDSLLKGKTLLMKNYLSKYQRDTCGIVTYQDTLLKSEFEGVKNIGDINNDKLNDTVFVVPTFNYCDDGNSYVFFDSSLPRLSTDSYCCHPGNIFSVGDIDEDGICEIGQYYSSCASHYKLLIVYSLKKNQWKEVGNCVYDLFYMDIGKPYSYFVRKISKGKFEMLEITNLTDDKTKIGKRNWKQFSM
ncbi:MAG: hypothetical protein ABI405_08810 [Parafilimonas sp.]